MTYRTYDEVYGRPLYLGRCFRCRISLEGSDRVLPLPAPNDHHCLCKRCVKQS